MKKTIPLLLTVLLALSLAGCGKQKETAAKWDCTVECANVSTEDSYIITYSDETVIPSAGVLTVQNRNDFPITAHLLTEGQEERSNEIPAGGTTVFFQLEPEQEYTVGLHAEVAQDTPILVMVYDGEWSETFSHTA